MRSILYSKILIISFLLFGCTSTASNSSEEFSSSVAITKDLVNKFGEIPRTPFLSVIENRLGSHLKLSGSIPRIILLRTNDRFAYSPGNGFVVLSIGLVKKLRSEAAFAFVVAHELAHQELGHLSRVHDFHDSSPDLKSLELAADKYAIGIVAISGYDPRAATDALLSAYSTEETTSDSHPSLSERIFTIQETITKSRWTPPGIIDSREYRKFIALATAR